MYGDLAQLENVGDKITETSVLHQLTGPDIPEQLGLHRLDGWTFYVRVRRCARTCSSSRVPAFP